MLQSREARYLNKIQIHNVPRSKNMSLSKIMFLNGNEHVYRMDQKKFSIQTHFRRPSIRERINVNIDESKYPVLTFAYVEPHVIELLVVVTNKMRQAYKEHINDYLLSTMVKVGFSKYLNKYFNIYLGI